MMAGCRQNVGLPALVFLLNIVSKANLVSKLSLVQITKAKLLYGR